MQSSPGGSLLPSRCIGRYVLIEEVGSGGMGVVYAAKDPELDRKVAVKLLRSQADEARLLREARALARLAHVNVVTVYDVSTFEDRVFIAMEFVDGMTLRRWLKEQPRSWQEVLDVFMRAGRGLAAAHAAGLVHRDFKPENVLLGKDGRVRVADFGIVGEVGEASSGTTLDALEPSLPPERLTLTGALIGTPAYMAPEQFRAEPVDGRTDQFSFCVALWEGLYGARPFQGATLSKLAQQVMGGRLPSPPPESSVPGWLRRVLARGLSVNRLERHPSMDALLSALEAGLVREELAARRVGGRYEPLQQGSGTGLPGVERAMDRLDARVVTLWRVGAPQRSGAPGGDEARLSLTRAFRRLASLRHPNLVGLLDFGFDRQRRPYVVLDLHDSSQGFLSSVRRQPAALQVDALVQLLRGLAYLHRHRVVLGSFGADSVFQVGNQIKLVPLGAAFEPAQVASAHAAPELARGQAPTVASDLYAFGCVAYELFAGHAPLDFPAVEVEPKLASVLSRLRAVEPSARYADATEVIVALSEAVGRPLAADTLETRESFLKAAPLVAREAELGQLRQALLDARQGRGSAWLIGGESGVGKSRLIDEIRALAIAEGTLVLQGQEQSEGGSSYHLFRGVLRRLAFLSDLDDFEAGALLPLVPDIGRLLDRPVQPVPELDAPSTHARLRDVVERVLRRQQQPLVLLLEDLHWSRSDSLKLLQGLYPFASELPLLIVATYRNDERPALPEELSGMRLLSLPRFGKEGIAQLASAMIGEAGRRPAVVDFLMRQTEGNAFFVVEVVRALAEEAGGLGQIGAAALPDTLLPGGIRRMIQRRLRSVPEAARPLLRLSAVIGKKLDRPLLEALAPGMNLEAWLAQCVQAAVLEQFGGEYRFAHDKLREGLLAEFTPEERKHLNGKVAQALEQLSQGGPERHAALAYHYGEAGDRVKEAHYAVLAGEQALHEGSMEGLRLLERALSLKDAMGSGEVERARLHRILGDGHHDVGEFARSVQHCEAALHLLGYALPRTRLGWALWTLWNVIVQLTTFLPWQRRTRHEARRELMGEAAHAAGRLSRLYIFRAQRVKVLALSLFATNLARHTGRPNCFALSVLAGMVQSIGLKVLAERYFARAREAALLHQDVGLVEILITQAGGCISVCQFERALQYGHEAREYSSRIGSGALEGHSEGMLGTCEYYPGRFSRMLEHQERCLAWRKDGGDMRFTAVFGEALALGRLGRTQEALRELEPCIRAVNRDNRQTYALLVGLFAALCAQAGRLDEARRAADECTRCFGSGALAHPTFPSLFEGPAEAYVACWRKLLLEERSSELPALAQLAWGHLRKVEACARRHPVIRPIALVFRGQLLSLSGKNRSARRSWEKAIAQSRTLGMPFHQGMAHLELGRACAPGSPEQRRHLEAAHELFSACGAAHHRGLASGLLEAHPA